VKINAQLNSIRIIAAENIRIPVVPADLLHVLEQK